MARRCPLRLHFARRDTHNCSALIYGRKLSEQTNLVSGRLIAGEIRRISMATATIAKPAAKGGSFLLESPLPGDVFTPADLTDDQKLIGQTAEEFVVKEVLPLAKDLENKKA